MIQKKQKDEENGTMEFHSSELCGIELSISIPFPIGNYMILFNLVDRSAEKRMRSFGLIRFPYQET